MTDLFEARVGSNSRAFAWHDSISDSTRGGKKWGPSNICTGSCFYWSSWKKSEEDFQSYQMGETISYCIQYLFSSHLSWAPMVVLPSSHSRTFLNASYVFITAFLPLLCISVAYDLFLFLVLKVHTQQFQWLLPIACLRVVPGSAQGIM